MLDDLCRCVVALVTISCSAVGSPGGQADWSAEEARAAAIEHLDAYEEAARYVGDHAFLVTMVDEDDAPLPEAHPHRFEGRYRARIAPPLLRIDKMTLSTLLGDRPDRRSALWNGRFWEVYNATDRTLRLHSLKPANLPERAFGLFLQMGGPTFAFRRRAIRDIIERAPLEQSEINDSRAAFIYAYGPDGRFTIVFERLPSPRLASIQYDLFDHRERGQEREPFAWARYRVDAWHEQDGRIAPARAYREEWSDPTRRDRSAQVFHRRYLFERIEDSDARAVSAPDADDDLFLPEAAYAEGNSVIDHRGDIIFRIGGTELRIDGYRFVANRPLTDPREILYELPSLLDSTQAAQGDDPSADDDQMNRRDQLRASHGLIDLAPGDSANVVLILLRGSDEVPELPVVTSPEGVMCTMGEWQLVYEHDEAAGRPARWQMLMKVDRIEMVDLDRDESILIEHPPLRPIRIHLGGFPWR